MRCGDHLAKDEAGKPMPCDPKPILYRPDPKGEQTYVNESGIVCKGTPDTSANRTGYISHFATCPNAFMHRRR